VNLYSAQHCCRYRAACDSLNCRLLETQHITWKLAVVLMFYTDNLKLAAKQLKQTSWAHTVLHQLLPLFRTILLHKQIWQPWIILHYITTTAKLYALYQKLAKFDNSKYKYVW